MPGSLYRTIEVWRPQDDSTATRYLCFEDVDRGLFWVKVADHVRHPLDKSALRQLNEQVAELILDSMIFESGEEDEVRVWSPSIRAAIEAFDRDFEN